MFANIQSFPVSIVRYGFVTIHGTFLTLARFSGTQIVNLPFPLLNSVLCFEHETVTTQSLGPSAMVRLGG